MIHGYSSPDAYTSLFLKRPWDYLHGVAGITAPKLNNTYLAYEVYKREPFPWRDINLTIGLDRETGRLLTHPNPSPRAYLSFAALGPMPLEEVLGRLTNGHAIHQVSLLENGLKEPLPEQGPAATAVAIGRFANNRIELEFTCPRPALLVLAEAAYPGWEAEVNGDWRETLTVNHWMRAVEVPAGANRVVFRYRERRLAVGLGISLTAGGLLLLTFRRTRRHSPRSSPSPDRNEK
jgi:hypothetical protein